MAPNDKVGSTKAGDRDKALATLRDALLHGYSDFASLDASPTLAPLRADPRYQQLLKSYRR